MKKNLHLLAPLLFFWTINTATAGCVGPELMGKCVSETNIPSYGSRDGYQGSSGQQYDYDLNKPADRNRYSVDIDAQRRDQNQGGWNQKQEMDLLRGQRGGGVRNDDPSDSTTRF